MRKTILSIIVLLILLLVPTMVFAAEGDVAKVGEESFATFEEALDAAKQNGEALVLLETLEIGKDATINIEGVNITGESGVNPLFLIEDASVIINGNGTISTTNGDAFSVLGNTGSDYETVAINSELEIGANVKVTARDNCIYIKGNGAKADVYGSLTSTGEYATIQGNGQDSSANTVINIYDGATILHANNHAIYQPQSGELNIYGGTIKGKTGVEIRAGKLLVEEGTNITATYNGLIVEPNGNGTTTTGAGIAVAQHTTGKSIDVVVNGGTIKGYYALNESNPQKNADDVLANVSIEINDGIFETIDGPVAVCSDSKKLSIAGGTFNKEVDKAYLVEGVTAEKDSNGNYVVGTRYNVVIKDVVNGTVISSVEKAMEGEEVQLTVNPALDYELSKLTVLNADNNEVEVVNGAFTMPAGGVTVIVEFEKIIPPMDYIISGNETENNNIGVVESEKVVETLDASLKADTKLNQKVEEERQKGNQVTIEIVVGELDKNAVSEEEKQKILQTVAANQTVHQYFDISVLVRTNQTELGKITELTEKMKFSMEISKDLIQEGRKFYILKIHGDEVERIEAVLNGTKLEFETSQFSTFALAYEDVENSTSVPAEGEKDDTPKTGAINIPVYVWITLAGMALVGIVTTKKSSKHSK